MEGQTGMQPEQIIGLTIDILRRLKRSRGGHKIFISTTRESIQSLLDREENPTHRDLEELKKNVHALKQSREKVQEKDNQIEDEVPEDDLESELEEASEFHAELLSFIQKCQRLIEEQENGNEANEATITSFNPRNSERNTASIKLPKVELPNFSGKYTQWTSFYDLFNASVHSNISLKPAEKLNYLKAALKGEAFTLIKKLAITDANYVVARDTLERRYANKRFTVRMHLEEILNQASIKSENGIGLRRLLESFQVNVAALDAQGCNCSDWGPILLHVLVGKLDVETRKQWELQQSGSDLQSLSDLLKFIDIRARALETIEKNSMKSQEKTKFSDQDSSNGHVADLKIQSYATQLENKKCTVPTSDQSVARTEEFKGMTPTQRKQYVQTKNLCINCLKAGHSVANCPSKFSCRQCNKKHHTMLHIERFNQSRRFEKANVSTADTPETQTTLTSTSHNASFKSDNEDTVALLGTCRLAVEGKDGRIFWVRALLDSGSETNFITERLAQQLQLPRRGSKTSIYNLGSSAPKARNGVVTVAIRPQSQHLLVSEMHVIPKITNQPPSQPIDVTTINMIKDLHLADKSFANPGSIDMLIGVELMNEITNNDRFQQKSLTFTRTVFGWVITGRAKTTKIGNHNSSSEAVCNFLQTNSALDISKFWCTERVPSTESTFTDSEMVTKNHYDCTTKFIDGRFQVKLPFKPDAAPRGESKASALRRFLMLEKRLEANPKLYQQYRDFIREFMDLKHLEEVPEHELELPPHKCFYLPHHCVQKESTTTKLRVVFDASAKTSNKVFLNDVLLVGSKIQDDLFDHLIRFRCYAIGITGDVAKMYKQIALDKKDKDFHRLFWRDTQEEPIKVYRMTRVTYGVGSSGYHSIRSLQEAGKNSSVEELIKRDFYVDDMLPGDHSIDEAAQLIQTVTKHWKSME